MLKVYTFLQLRTLNMSISYKDKSFYATCHQCNLQVVILSQALNVSHFGGDAKV